MTVIVSSQITSETVEMDGRRWIQETHIDDSNVQYQRMYLCDADFDENAALTQYAEQLNAQFAANLTGNLNG